MRRRTKFSCRTSGSFYRIFPFPASLPLLLSSQLPTYFCELITMQSKAEPRLPANIVDKLKKGWNAYRQKLLMVHSKFDYKKDHAAILSWHFKQSLHLDDELEEGSRRSKSCRYCGCGSNRYHCSSNLRAYWEAAQLLSLVMPPSGAAETVFSLLNNHFNQHQTRSLSDQIFLSLYLSHNKR